MEDVQGDDDEEELVVLGDAGCAAMWTGAALPAASASAAATAGRREGIFSGRALEAGGSRGPAGTWRPVGRSGRHWFVGEARGCVLRIPGLAGLGSCNVGGRARRRPRGGKSSHGLHSAAGGGVGLGFRGCVRGACVGHWAAGVCGLPGVGGGEARSAGGSVARVCRCSGGGGGGGGRVAGPRYVRDGGRVSATW